MARPSFPPWAADYIGLPYLAGGQSMAGADCWGMVAMIHDRELGNPLPAYEGPLFSPGCDRAGLAEQALAYSRRFPEVHADQVKLGDVILMRTGRHPFHCGLILAPGWMLHTEEQANGACIETYEGLAWKRRIISFHRYTP